MKKTNLFFKLFIEWYIKFNKKKHSNRTLTLFTKCILKELYLLHWKQDVFLLSEKEYIK
jgi:hypothetical protein